MTIKDLKIVTDQYDNNSSVFIQIGIGTSYRIDKGQLHSEHDPDLYPVLKSTHDKATNSLVLQLE